VKQDGENEENYEKVEIEVKLQQSEARNGALHEQMN